MIKQLLLLAVLFPLATSVFARRGDKIVECVDKDGNTRFAGRECDEGERRVIPKALPEKDAPKIKAPPGILSDIEGVAVLPRTGEWTVHNTLGRFKWDKKKKTWTLKGRIGKMERDAARNAVEAFNMTRDLGVSLKIKNTEDAKFDLNKVWDNRNRFVIYWAKDAKPGTLPKPYRVRDGVNAGGCSIIVKNPDGSYSYGIDGRIQPGAQIVGAALFMVEYSRKVRKSFKCPKAGHRYELLHQLGHCVGLGHGTPTPSVMGGTCGEDYYPNDVLNFRKLYGKQ